MLLKQSNEATTTPQAKQQGKTKSHRTKKTNKELVRFT